MAIALNPKNAEHYFSRAIIYYVLGYKEKKKNLFNDLRKIIELDPKYKYKIKDTFKLYAEDEEFKKIIK